LSRQKRGSGESKPLAELTPAAVLRQQDAGVQYPALLAQGCPIQS
jgi:hypothetical protein